MFAAKRLIVLTVTHAPLLVSLKGQSAAFQEITEYSKGG
jgi:hypothetical protein